MGKILKHYKNGELVYPNPTKDGLQLWYDVAGKRNTDFNKEVLEDLSGNGNDGVLHNFNFTEESGYNKNKLLFDGIDDKVEIPDLQLSENAMSVQVGDKAYVYEDDKVITISEDGSVEVGGKNLLLNSEMEKETSTYDSIPFDSSALFDYVGQEVTLSFYAKRRDSVKTRIDLYFRNSSSGVVGGASDRFELTDSYKRYTHTITVTETLVEEANQVAIRSNRYVQEDDIDKRIMYKNPQVEIGNKATDWTPAPEDYKTTILSPSTLDKLQLYNRPLVKDEMLQNVESEGLKELKEGQVVQDGLILHYDFSKESNDSEYKGKAFDYSGNGHHGTLQNFSYAEGSGYQGDGLRFDGVDDYITSDNVLSGLSEFVTVEITISDVENLISQTAISMNYYNFELRILLDGGILAYYSDGKSEGYKQPNTGATTLTDGLTHTVTISWDKVNGITHMYTDGFHIKSQTLEPAVGERPEQLRIGSRSINGSIHFSGTYKSAKLYNRILTPEEIQHNYLIEKEKFNL